MICFSHTILGAFELFNLLSELNKNNLSAPYCSFTDVSGGAESPPAELS